MENRIFYFEQPGPDNTRVTLEAARDRALALGIKNVVVASSHGGTARAAAAALAGTGCQVVVVTICAGYTDAGWTMTDSTRRELESAGIKVFTGIHALGDDVGGALQPGQANSVVAQTLYRFSQGMKVCVEIALMAADAGLIPPDEETIAIAGTSDGADTAIVLTPAYPRKFKELKVHEILTMPR